MSEPSTYTFSQEYNLPRGCSVVASRLLCGRRSVGKLVAFLLILYTAYFVLYTSAHAANYSFSPPSGSYENGKNFTVRVMVDAGSEGVNSGEGTVTFDASKLSLVSASKAGSAFGVWVTDPEDERRASQRAGGTIEFVGGSATGAITGSKPVLTLTFKGKNEGATSIAISKGNLLNGPGQNALTGALPTASYTITAAAAKPEPKDEPKEETKKPERQVNIPVPNPPELKSATHKDPAEWYRENNVKITWDIPYGVTGMRLLFTDSATATPSVLHEPPISEFAKEGVGDGVWYLHAEYKNRGGWSSSTTFKLQIDSTPPPEFQATAVGGDLTAQVRFDVTDALSGISLYRIALDEARARDVQPSELVAGGYTLTNVPPGEHTITVTAIDRAGNEREAKAQVTVTGELPPEEGAEGEVKTSGFGAIYWVSLLFMAALAIVVTMLIQERRKHHEEKDRLKRETMEASDKLINIFGVLRDEIEEKVVELSHKPNMTDNERAILEGLKDALDISEELIDKEIEDVRKLLK